MHVTRQSQVWQNDVQMELVASGPSSSFSPAWQLDDRHLQEELRLHRSETGSQWGPEGRGGMLPRDGNSVLYSKVHLCVSCSEVFCLECCFRQAPQGIKPYLSP